MICPKCKRDSLTIDAIDAIVNIDDDMISDVLTADDPQDNVVPESGFKVIFLDMPMVVCTECDYIIDTILAKDRIRDFVKNDCSIGPA